MYIIILWSCPIIIAVVLFCLCHRTLAPYQHRMQPCYASSPPHMVPAIARMPVHPKLNNNQGKRIYVADHESYRFQSESFLITDTLSCEYCFVNDVSLCKPIMTTMFEGGGNDLGSTIKRHKNYEYQLPVVFANWITFVCRFKPQGAYLADDLTN